MKNLCKILFCIMLVAFASGCAKSDIIDDGTKEQAKETVIKLIYTIDTENEMNGMRKLVDDFNKEYEGKYKVEIELYNAKTDNYRTLIKRLNVVDDLPTIITDVAYLPSYFELLINDNRLVDISSYILKDSEWMGYIDEYIIDGYEEKEGAKYLSTQGTACFSSVGFFYNKELFAKAEINEFPTTWEDFFDVCSKLKENGITPLGLNTEGTAFAPMVIASAFVARNEKGTHFMNTMLPDTYSNGAGEDIAWILSEMFKYTTADAIGNDFDVANEHFLQGEVAMLPNGFLELESIPKNMEDVIGFATFPENVIIASPEMSGWAVANTHSKEVIDGAVQFLKYRTKNAYDEKTDFMYEGQLNNVSGDYKRVVSSHIKVVPNYQMQWNSILQQEVISEITKKLINGEISSEEFVAEMDKSIVEYNKEQ